MGREFIPKEVSWLSFNERVLQEAGDASVPLLERLKFLGIYSSNMDEFFEVRVATLKRLASMGKHGMNLIGMDPDAVLSEIRENYRILHKRYDGTYRQIIEEMRRQGVCFVNERELSPDQERYVGAFFREKVLPAIFPIMLRQGVPMPHCTDGSIYLMVRLWKSVSGTAFRYAMIEVSSLKGGRFVILPDNGGVKYVMMLDDVIRLGLPFIFRNAGFDRFEAYDFKVTRDAELDLNDDIGESFLSKINKSISLRKRGNPVRLGYDENMPPEMLAFILKKLGLSKGDTVVAGGRYHNFKDFMKFPDVFTGGTKTSQPAVEHELLSAPGSMLSKIAKRDILLHFPYHSFGSLIELLREASMDPKVKSIKITLYRVAKDSGIVGALVNAVKNGKQVTVLLELQARFDEMNNIRVANILKDEGATVMFSMPGIKVHSKLILITRSAGRRETDFCAVSTGNFNEITAGIYTDFCLLTARKKVADDVKRLFSLFSNLYQRYDFETLVVSPFSMRDMLNRHIRIEAKNARAGKDARIDIKLNNFSDREMVASIYEAAKAGVKVRMIVRGMFSVVPGIPGLSENIEARCVVDKYLEHSRLFMFHNGGDEVCYISSADVLPRNMDHRIEVTCPILDGHIRKELKDVFEICWKDNVKGRILDGTLSNEYFRDDGPAFRSQEELHAYYRDRQAMKISPENVSAGGKP